MFIRNILCFTTVFCGFIPFSTAFIHCAGARQTDPFRYQITMQPQFQLQNAAAMNCRELSRKRIVYGLFHLPLNRLGPLPVQRGPELLRFREILTWGDIGYTALGFLVSFITRTQIMEACQPSAPFTPFDRPLDYTIVFPGKNALVPDKAVPLLNALADEMRKKRGWLLIVGHAEPSPEAATDRALATRRALNVKEILTQYGVQATRMATLSAGPDWPGRTGSRVEFYLIPERRP
ncbi:MAG: OmpA family protein [Spirochaetales bacterium]|nr:OmpA family protein [Spirochaetales bacterium]